MKKKISFEMCMVYQPLCSLEINLEDEFKIKLFIPLNHYML